jgi:hypothetical protein
VKYKHKMKISKTFERIVYFSTIVADYQTNKKS